MLKFYSHIGAHQDCITLFDSMRASNVMPDAFVFPILIKSMGEADAVLHGHVLKLGHDSDRYVRNAIMYMYAKYGPIDFARRVFDEMPERMAADWNSMISGYWRWGNDVEAGSLFSLMPEKNVITWTAMVTGYSKTHDLVTARRYFDQMPVKNIISWNAMLSGYSQNGFADEALKLLNELVLNGVQPDDTTWVAVISACSDRADADLANSIMNMLNEKNVKLNYFVMTALIDMHAKCGNLAAARKIFNELGVFRNVVSWNAMISGYTNVGDLKSARELFDIIPCKDVVSWNSMIAGYAQNGQSTMAIELFKKMINSKHTKPDEVTMVSVISSCAHLGALELGKWALNFIYENQIALSISGYNSLIFMYSKCGSMKDAEQIFDKMGTKDVISFNTLISGFAAHGRVGKLDEAKDLVTRMPMVPHAGVYGSLLNASRICKRIDIGEFAANQLFKIEPENSGNYVLLSNMYASMGKWRDVERIRGKMKLLGVKKTTGWSYVEFGGKLHKFIVGDKSHERSNDIYKLLMELRIKMRKSGYIADKESVLRDVDDEEKEEMMGTHSEKLALCFGLLVSDSGAIIRIVKNLRVCWDCHEAMKIISKLEGREIIVRDNNRFHCFHDGSCSCKDYWYRVGYILQTIVYVMSLVWVHALSRQKTLCSVHITAFLQKNLFHHCVKSTSSIGLQFNKGSYSVNLCSHFHHSTFDYRSWFSTVSAQDDENDGTRDLGFDVSGTQLFDAKAESGKPVEFSKVDAHLLPTVLLIGRPNVGKSALFNRLIRRREALVYNTPNDHVTRDIREGIAKLGDLRFKVLDSAGLEAEALSGSVLGRTAEMTANVLRMCNFALFLIDARDGLQPMDLDVGKWLRKHAPGIKIIMVMNKSESLDDGFGSVIAAASEVRTLGFGDPVALSAETGLGMNDLYEVLRPLLEEHMLQIVHEAVDETNEDCEFCEEEESKLPLQLAFVGRPNVGKSTLLNAILQENRVLVGPEAGLTRDSVRVEFEFEGRTIYMVDTAGWLQRTKSEKGASSLSIVQSRKNLMRAHVVALVLDGQEVSKARKSMTHDEVVIARRAIEEGRGLVVIVNKMDLLEERLYDRVVKAVPEEIQTMIPQVTGIPVVFVSALEGKGRIDVMNQVIETYKKWCLRLSTARLNRWLRKVMSRHSWKDLAAQPKVKYFTQVKARPPTFVAFVGGKVILSDTDLRFLTRSLKEDFDMGGVPVRILQRAAVKSSCDSINGNGNNKTKKYGRKHVAEETSDKRKITVNMP
ncbi:hypothetical protein E3N88_28180 [Mikania micrantha]|uniref:GTPase Der n=1 Tax=Mikania micrantha TaxID=192012 RepID=A0A5N6MYR2_9ASTR|nr:hypothetical protein E3N88_28180 [Mikania micrantha]